MKKPKYSKRYCMARNCGCLYDPSAPNQKYCNAHKNTKTVSAKPEPDVASFEALLEVCASDFVSDVERKILIKWMRNKFGDLVR